MIDRVAADPAVNPDLVRWCAEQLGEIEALEPLASAMSDVLLARLGDGSQVVVKVREDPLDRAAGCLELQRRAADKGIPCPRPLTPRGRIGGLSVHAEEWRPGGERLAGDTPYAATLSGRLLADVMGALADFAPARLPLPNPDWVHWDYQGPTGWPPHAWIDSRPNRDPLPEFIDDAARRVRRRMRGASLRPVVGHADWEAQNLRWQDGEPFVIHDWDSAAYLPEAAIAGAAAGAFASDDRPTLSSLEGSETFLEAYESRRGVAFTAEERVVAWAASLWPAIHNARAEFRCEMEPVAGRALRQQAPERLARAGA